MTPEALRRLGFSYISYDMPRGAVRITAWRAGNRATYSAYGATVEEAEADLMDQIEMESML